MPRPRCVRRVASLYQGCDGRSVAQPGRALSSGGRGRKFESCHSDHAPRPSRPLPWRHAAWDNDIHQLFNEADSANIVFDRLAACGDSRFHALMEAAISHLRVFVTETLLVKFHEQGDSARAPALGLEPPFCTAEFELRPARED